MNRKERRNMEKKLGITKYKKSLSLNKRMELIRENIIEGKKKQKEMKEVRRLQEQEKVDEVASTRIAFIATDLMINQDISYVEAQEKAKELYEQEIKSTS